MFAELSEHILCSLLLKNNNKKRLFIKRNINENLLWFLNSEKRFETGWEYAVIQTGRSGSAQS